MQTIQQQRAKYALDSVRAFANNPKIDKKQRSEYKSYAANLPAMIHINGLGQAAAFYKSKGGTHKALYGLLSGWLTKDNQPYAGKAELLEGIVDCDMHRYRLAQAEAQVLMEWVKKFAGAYMSED